MVMSGRTSVKTVGAKKKPGRSGRVPPAGSLVVWGGLTFTVKAADDRRVQKVEIARKPAPGAAATGPQHNAPVVPPPDKVH